MTAITNDKPRFTKVTIDRDTHELLSNLKRETGVPQARIVKAAVTAIAPRLRQRRLVSK